MVLFCTHIIILFNFCQYGDHPMYPANFVGHCEFRRDYCEAAAFVKMN